MLKQSHLIIGSNSFLGQSVSKKLQVNGNRVLGVYNKNKDNLFSEIEHIQIDKIKTLDNNFDFVYLISSFVPNKASKNIAENLDSVNVRLVEAISKQFSKAKFIFCSSVSVYKESKDAITENSVTEPNNDYGKSKLKGEAIIKRHYKYAIVRISSMYGVNMKLTTFLPLIVIQALNNKEIVIFGDGSRLQNYIHVDDVSNYLIKAGKYKTNTTFLAAAEQSVSNKVVAGLIKEILPETKISFKRLDESKSYLYDNAETKYKLKIKEEKKLKTELKNTIEWMKKES